MKKIIFLITIIIFFYSLNAFSTDLPENLMNYLENKFPGITLRIDNSFLINNELFLPLISKSTKGVKKIELIYLVPDKDPTDLPRLFWFSNDWVFVRLIKQKDGTQSILKLKEISENYRDEFLKLKFPSDLVIPSDFKIEKELASLSTDLPVGIKKEKKEQVKEPVITKEVKTKTTETKKIEPKDVEFVEKKLEKAIEKQTSKVGSLSKQGDILYLTSPDTGKIVYLDLGDISMVYSIQTTGTPWEITFNKNKNLVFVTDFTKDLIYELKPMQGLILRNYSLTSMSSPNGISVSQDGSLFYVLNSLTSDFVVYKSADGMALVKTKLPPNPNSFSFIEESNLVGITSPSTNRLLFLNANTFGHAYQFMIEGGPEKVIYDPHHKLIYVTNRNVNSVSIIEVGKREVKETIQVGDTPTSLAVHPTGKWLYVSNGKSNSISVIDLDSFTVSETIPLPVETQFPADIEITRDGMSLVVTSETTNTISIIDLDLKKINVKLDVGATTHAAILVDRESEIRGSGKTNN